VGGVSGAAVGGVVGGVCAVPLVVKGFVAKPVAGIADALDESATAIRSTPESLMGKSAVNWDDRNLDAVVHSDAKYVGIHHANGSKSQPGGLREGVKVGLNILGKEVTRGIQGLYLEPMTGAKEDGYPGFISGGGRGVVNAIAAPVAGSLYFGAAVARGSANWAENPKMPQWSEMWGRLHRRGADEVTVQNEGADGERAEDVGMQADANGVVEDRGEEGG
jgi:hypothetical protein